MSVNSFLRSFLSSGPDAVVRADADRLIARWGISAFDVAAQIASREDMGWLKSPAVGHWSRVKSEVGQRLGRKDQEPRADFAPSPSPASFARHGVEA